MNKKYFIKVTVQSSTSSVKYQFSEVLLRVTKNSSRGFAATFVARAIFGEVHLLLHVTCRGRSNIWSSSTVTFVAGAIFGEVKRWQAQCSVKF